MNTSGTRGLRASGITRMRAGDILDSLFNPTQITDKRTYVMLVQLDELNNNLLLSKDSGSDGFKIYPNQNRLKFTQADDRGAAYEVNSQVATDQAAGVPNDNIQGNVYLWSIEVEEDDDPQWAGHFRHRYYLGGDEINVGYVGTRGTGLSGGTAGAALQLFGGNASYITLFAFAGFEGKDTALRELLEQRMAYDHNMPSLLGQYSGSHTHDGGPATL